MFKNISMACFHLYLRTNHKQFKKKKGGGGWHCGGCLVFLLTKYSLYISKIILFRSQPIEFHLLHEGDLVTKDPQPSIIFKCLTWCWFLLCPYSLMQLQTDYILTYINLWRWGNLKNIRFSHTPTLLCMGWSLFVFWGSGYSVFCQHWWTQYTDSMDMLAWFCRANIHHWAPPIPQILPSLCQVTFPTHQTLHNARLQELCLLPATVLVTYLTLLCTTLTN